MTKRHLFLSYCSDNKQEVQRLRDDLVAAGECVWWDQDINPGKNWKLAIRQALKESYAVVFCFSRETETRLRSGMYPELRDAIEIYREYSPESVFLIPVRLSSCEVPDVSIDSTTTFRDHQVQDLFPSSQWAAGVQRIVKAVRGAPEHP